MTLLIGIMALVLIVQAFIGLIFFISSIQEKEPRATLFGGIQFLGMLCLVILFFFLWGFGFFETPLGIGCLIAAYIIGALAVFTLVKRSPANPKALQGTEGLIMGEVKRFDERDQVFARNRALRPGSEEYRAYYEAHPENEAFDTRRRERGGVNGKPGFIDRPHHMPNMAAAAAWGRMSFQLSAPEMVRPEPLPPFQGKQVFFLIVALLAAGNHVGFDGLAAPYQRDDVVHGQFPGREALAAVVTASRSPFVLPPLGPAEFAGLALFAFDLIFRDGYKEEVGHGSSRAMEVRRCGTR